MTTQTKTSPSEYSVGYSTYRYCLMHKDGKFQWRWVDRYPPEYQDPAVSPVFDSYQEAMEWSNQKHGQTSHQWTRFYPNEP